MMAKKSKNPFAKKVGSGMAKTKGAIKPGKAKGMPLKVAGGGMPTEKVQGGKAVGTAHGATFKMPHGKGKKKLLKK
jgi:hypothetical protein